MAFPGWRWSSDQLPSEDQPPAPARDWHADLDALSVSDEGASRAASPAPCDDAAVALESATEASAGWEWQWPGDILLAVLAHHSAADLCVARAVGREWHSAASSDALWHALRAADPRFSGRPPRRPCGAGSLSPPPPRYLAFWQYAWGVRSLPLRRWLDLQKGWDRLELLLQPACGERRPEAPDGRGGQARKLAGIRLVYRCLQLLQLECAETLGATIHPEAAADEALLGRLLAGFQTYSRWLAEVAGSTGALTRRVAAQRGSELPDVQHTPTLSAAGLAAFRSAVVLHPAIEAPLARHISRCSAHGGWTAESGRLMQQLIDLDGALSRLDVRDDHLSEERGLTFSQGRLRDALLRPLRRCFREHASQWFCGTRIPPQDRGLYIGHKRRRGLIAEFEDPSNVQRLRPTFCYKILEAEGHSSLSPNGRRIALSVAGARTAACVPATRAAMTASGSVATAAPAGASAIDLDAAEAQLARRRSGHCPPRLQQKERRACSRLLARGDDRHHGARSTATARAARRTRASGRRARWRM
ncbi:hypothetical protein EMIHUDRAFT_199867 [Emiliania huxleyi CCMP1516]|uniref:F-box domain-containing protein n=2 Tax=Emiliania huxleyi TaxID=2903 RepID=A0A0D3KUI8_EMIH1|nr:hypothetical protein EMIHUDRAFT_199867 [Emiliania huxleyi CCMP1516]EOD39423.1 hypothetical protein EMIHUDRAFT_199867 [Emiliania huxleyi CCMP1516]|eukprot:XP_005791852.1 hypothetical protein EMIHUDRAFT_199867 [Emiliania huxleyi CCMP1516]